MVLPKNAGIGLLMLLATSHIMPQTSNRSTMQYGGRDQSLAESQLSPAAAYQEAVRPVEVTRHAIANWSEIEQASLAIAIKQASTACAARQPGDYSGDALADLIRLCALGQAWPVVERASGRYIEQKTTRPRLAEVYAAKIDAELHLKDEAAALRDAMQTLEAVPYSSVPANATTEALDYMELLYTGDAVALATKRQPLILEALGRTPATPGPADSGTTAIAPTIPDLYRQGLRMAVLQQLDGQTEASRRTVAALDAVLSPGLSSDDHLEIEGVRHQYAHLGELLPPIAPSRSLDLSSRIPEIPARDSITALLLFPDWCAQCIRLARQIPEGGFSVMGHKASMYGLLVETVPAEKPPKISEKTGETQPDSFNPAYAAASLGGTPTVMASSELLAAFDAVDVPLLIITDSRGVVRYIEAVDENALLPGGLVDSAIALVGKRWPGSGAAKR
jgi:hypothetical protein